MELLTSINSSSINNSEKKSRVFWALLFFSFSITIVYSQNCEWAKSSINGGQQDRAWGSTIDKFGNVYITGIFTGTSVTFGSYTLTNWGAANIFLVKYDSNGNVLWARSGSESGSNDVAYAVTTDNYGNVFITGFISATNTFGTYTLTTHGYYDAFIVKYDPNGNVLWAKNEGGTGLENSYGVQTDSGGNVYIGGYSTSTLLTIGTYTFSNPPDRPFLIKYDSSGNVIWAKSADCLHIYGLTVDKADNIYITGEFYCTTTVLDTYTLSNPNGGYFLAKINSNGNTIWATKDNPRYGYSIATNNNLEVFLTGCFPTSTTSIGTFTFTNTQGGYSDNFIVKYNQSGNVIWAKTFGSPIDDYAYSVATNKNSVFTTGRFTNSITINSSTLAAPSSSYDPMYFLQFDFNGNLKWSTALESGGGTGNLQNWVCADSSGNVVISSGYSVNPLVIGNYSLPLTGSQNVFVAKYNFNNVGFQELQKNNPFDLYPDPANDFLVLKNAQTDFASFEIVNSTGQVVKKVLSDELGENHRINVTDLPPGLYIFRLNDKGGDRSCAKFIIER